MEAWTPVPGIAAASGRPPRRRGERRLGEALSAVDELPALAESRARLLRRLSEDRPPGDLVATVESDPALAIWILRAAHADGGEELAGVAAAVESLSRAELMSAARSISVLDYFEMSPSWGSAPQRFRLHAVAVQRIADRIITLVGHGHRDELLTAALLHDAGKLALEYAYDGYPHRIHAPGSTPQERLSHERERLGLDHAAVGGVLARRWALSRRACLAIERHHADDPGEPAALVALADMLAHHGAGRPIDHRRLVRMAQLVGLGGQELRALLYGLPLLSEERPREREPSPLSRREREVLRLLAEGNRYKQIGAAIGMAESTVRTHINNIYKKLGVIDRAQAVLRAKDRGWI